MTESGEINTFLVVNLFAISFVYNWLTFPCNGDEAWKLPKF